MSPILEKKCRIRPAIHAIGWLGDRRVTLIDQKWAGGRVNGGNIGEGPGRESKRGERELLNPFV